MIASTDGANRIVGNSEHTTGGFVDLNLIETPQLRIFALTSYGTVRGEGFHLDDVLFGSLYWGSDEMEHAPSPRAVEARQKFLQIRDILRTRGEWEESMFPSNSINLL